MQTTFEQQAEKWLRQMQHRNRKPVAVSTISLWRGCLDNWLSPRIGELPLEKVNNAALKQIVAAMMKGGLSAKTINTYTQVVKFVVASAMNDEGEQMFPRKWNHEFVDMPIVKKSGQNTPSFSSEMMTEWLNGSICARECFSSSAVLPAFASARRSGLRSAGTPRPISGR
jgi:hypothetical protein